MLGFLFILLVIFVLAQRKRYLMRYWNERWGGRFGRSDAAASGSPSSKDAGDKDYWYERGAREAERFARKFERKAERFERKAKRFEHRLKSGLGSHGDTAGTDWWRFATSALRSASGANPSPASAEQARKAEEERQTYERARKRAAAEAGFYVHLMWYGTVIGFLFLINLMTTGYPWFLWPALGWGFGLMSHFSTVFGWRWIQERVFQPAIQREVQREVQQEKEVMRTEKQASLDELTATFAHEIRNPIAAAKSLVQQMGEDPTSNENVEYAKVALDELARVEKSVSHLLKYAKEEDYNFGNVNLAAVLDAALTQMRAKLETKSVTVSRNYLGGPTIRADADKLRQVFSNVIDNAIDAMEGVTSERRIEMSIQTGDAIATVRVRDNGCGIAPDKIAKIFNPFYTSKENGTGLGMAVAKKIIEAHNGTIKVDSRVGAGTEFTFSIPLADGARMRPAAPDGTDFASATPPPARDTGSTAPVATPAAASANGAAVRIDAQRDGVQSDGVKSGAQTVALQASEQRR
jgi:signal transduction histidine kinase